MSGVIRGVTTEVPLTGGPGAGTAATGVTTTTTLGRTGAAASRAITTVNVERLPQKLYVYNLLNKNTASYCDMSQMQEDAVGGPFIALKTLIAPTSTNFTVNLSKMIVSYKVDGVEYMNDLQAIIEAAPECLRAYRELADSVMPVWGAPFRHTSFTGGCKTSDSAPRPLGRANKPIYEDLPSNFSETAKSVLNLYASSYPPPTDVDQETALKRMVAVEKVIDLQEKKCKALEQKRLDPTTPAAEIPMLEKQLRKLRRANVDRYALYLAVAFYPTNQNPTVDEISEAANRAKAALEQQIEAKRTQHNNDNNTTWHNFKVSSSNFIRGFNENFVGEQEVPVIKEDKSYCADAAALMFSALPLAQARSAYIDFCHEHSFHPKTDCTEESMMHFIAGVMSTPAGTDAVNLLQTAIGTITDPLLQADCNAALAAFNFTELKRLVNTLPSRGQDAQNDCRKALQLLDTDYVQAVESLPETTDPERLYKATCRTELKQALTDAHRLWHNALPFPAPIVGDPALTIGDKVDRIQTILDFQ